MSKYNEFLHGYAACLGSILSIPSGYNTEVVEVYRDEFEGKTEQDLKEIGVADFDIELFKRYNLLTK